jgi:hypothetical protein
MTLPDGTFRFLTLCAQRPGSAAVVRRLPAALATLPSFGELVEAAEQHGLEPLVLAHVTRAGITIPSICRDRLRARHVQHAHAAAVRSIMVADVARAMAQAHVPLLVLKGAALAHLVYGDSRLRPMRDVDLLVRKPDVGRAHHVLVRCGFRPGGIAVPAGHHHVQGMTRTIEGATVTIELHHELMVRTPFVEPCGYDDLIRSSQPFDWGGMTYRTLGCEDMLWHVYAHAFVINTLRPGAIRLLSVADLVHAVEAWADRIDWNQLRRRYGRMLRALHVLHDLVPWSPHVVEKLREQAKPPRAAVRARPMDSDPNWSVALIPHVLWLPEWWFRMRYGITCRRRWLWYRLAGHPARLVVSVARAVAVRISERLQRMTRRPVNGPIVDRLEHLAIRWPSSRRR